MTDEKNEAKMRAAIQRFIAEGGTYEEAVAALKAAYERKDEETKAASVPLKH